eukprot:gnl/Carplike_NY0171/23013_a39567_69.p1 GENE.gnl/Carplike_NY0171/23013_a39567_69~~gnl/Carplike_NY0171/23013_a39567_69.p1  ORF type:complete len:103 (-),score=16.28 gnl/Carplike_NY0171/23013_a39567_69:93-401(-)
MSDQEQKEFEKSLERQSALTMDSIDKRSFVEVKCAAVESLDIFCKAAKEATIKLSENNLQTVSKLHDLAQTFSKIITDTNVTGSLISSSFDAMEKKVGMGSK